MKFLILLAALALTGCATPADAAHCRGANGKFIKCPAPAPAPIPAPTPTPTPVPAPAPASIDNPMTGQSPGVGAPDIATTDHNVNNDLVAAAIPPSGSNGSKFDVGAFRFTCVHTNAAADDPTVYPGQPGKSHLHDQTGVRGWSAYSNYGNLRVNGGGSNCNNVEGYDGWLSRVADPASERNWSANRTPYWQPALLDGKGNMIEVDFISVYYKQIPTSSPILSDQTNPQYQGKGVPLPNGIKYIFGAFPNDSSKAPDATVRFMCTGGASGAVYEGGDPALQISFAEAISCAKAHADGTFEVRVTGPNCWDGVNLDSADHRSHMAMASYGDWGYPRCDAQHPYVIPEYTYAASYTVLPSDTGDIHFSSDEMDNTKPRGWSFHVDYGPAAWDPVVLKMWTDNCIEKLLNCSAGNLGNGYALKGAAQGISLINGVYTPWWRNPVRLVPVP